MHSFYVAELHNTWSSISSLCFFGLLGIFYGNPTGEKRFTLAYVILFLIGVGSAGLHGSLHWFFQSSDELPMLYLINTLNFILEEYDTPLGQRKHLHLARLLVGLSLLNTVVYYSFQSMYIIFFITFSTSNLRLDYKILNVFCKDIRNKCKVAKKIAIISFVSYFFFAFPIWAVDMLQCERVLSIADELPGPLKGMTLHVLWHIFAAHGAYCTIVLVACFRMIAHDRPYDCFMLFGVIPLVKQAKKEKSH